MLEFDAPDVEFIPLPAADRVARPAVHAVAERMTLVRANAVLARKAGLPIAARRKTQALWA